MTVGRRRNWKNQGFLKQREPKMVRTEQLKYIQLLHERGEGSLKISKRLSLSRNTVRKYLERTAHRFACLTSSRSGSL